MQPTGDLLIDVAISGLRWNLDGSRTLDFSLSGGFEGERWSDPAAATAAVAAALDIFSEYANINFNFLGVFDDPAAAASAGSEINVFLDANNAHVPVDYWGVGLFPVSAWDSIYQGAPGDVILSAAEGGDDIGSFDLGSAGWALLLHEIGHALGLKHPHDDGGTGYPTFSDVGLEDLDHDWFSIMSYEDDYSEDLLHFNPATPMLVDVLALQYLYGPNMSANLGDTTYSIRAVGVYGTIWDAGGIDTLSAATSGYGWEIVLPDRAFSTLIPSPVGSAVPLVEAGLDSPGTLYWLLGDLENVTGSALGDDILGNQAANRLLGGGGGDTISGAAGADTIVGANGSNYLRGDEGDDSLTGGVGFDDINGNMGADTASGGEGGDWVVGGRDGDDLHGDNGNDIVYGNMGADTCFGDTGDDWVRGGKDDDIIYGGAGDDWMSGDIGNDTISGGAGADIFHTFGEAGVDKVYDFKLSEGDRVLLEPGTVYSVAQIGGDVAITMGGGGQMILVGVSLSALTGDWIYGA
ncbi:MAG: reprolysin-like metallopeptidase [Phenylobacterium sp.]|uniref:reprolysin-like metallopeptidase n=1 Tax=Phenylobacterium sp. TaxID=1871053 RepID=UPI00391D929C